MPLVVDASNVLHVTGVLPPALAGPDELGLAELVARSRWRRDRVLLVCDGGPPGDRMPFPSLQIVIRRSGSRSADAVIAQEIEGSSYARRITVVTNDRGLLASVRPFGCRTMSSERFLEDLAADATMRRESRPRGEPRGDGPGTADEWLREFGFDPPASADGARP